MTDTTEQKRQAAARSIEHVQDGMVVGLGSGSTAALMVELLGERVRAGLNITGIPTSERTASLARQGAIPLTSFDQTTRLDLTIDGADELDDQLRLIKGAGGALLREKIVASLSDRLVIIADGSKRVETLGKFALPVEVIPFAASALSPRLEALGCTLSLRQGAQGQPFRTDEGNLIFDCSFGSIDDPEGLAHALNAVPGVVEHGLFIGLANLAIVAGSDGLTEISV